MRKSKLFLACLLFINSLGFAQYNVSTFAGSGLTGHIDGSLMNSRFNRPVGITVDSIGNILVCDFDNHCIRKIDTSGVVSTIAGTPGVSGYADGAGSVARFNKPGGICTDRIGNIYVTDNFNHRIRKIDTNNNVTTLAGDGLQGYIDSTSAFSRLNVPRDLVYDEQSGFLYFVDRNDVIRRLSPNGKVSTYAGTGTSGFIDGPRNSARFDFPTSVDIDIHGNLIVTDRYNHAIRKIDTSGNVSTIAGNGTAGHIDANGSSARFDQPVNLTIDSYNNIYIIDYQSNYIRLLDTNNNVSTIAGDGTSGFLDGPSLNAKLGEVFDLEILDNEIYFTDALNERIRKVTGITTGIKNLKEANEKHLLLFPNPVKDLLYISTSQQEQNLNISIYSQHGSFISEYKLSKGNNQQIDLSYLPSGIYFIKETASGKVEKLIKL